MTTNAPLASNEHTDRHEQPGNERSADHIDTANTSQAPVQHPDDCSSCCRHETVTERVEGPACCEDCHHVSSPCCEPCHDHDSDKLDTELGSKITNADGCACVASGLRGGALELSDIRQELRSLKASNSLPTKEHGQMTLYVCCRCTGGMRMTAGDGICCSECGHFKCPRCLRTATHSNTNDINEDVPFVSGLRGGMLNADDVSTIFSGPSLHGGIPTTPSHITNRGGYENVFCCECCKSFRHRNATVCMHCGHEICPRCEVRPDRPEDSFSLAVASGNTDNSEHIPFISGLRGGNLDQDNISSLLSDSSDDDDESVFNCCQCGKHFSQGMHDSYDCSSCGHHMCGACMLPRNRAPLRTANGSGTSKHGLSVSGLRGGMLDQNDVSTISSGSSADDEDPIRMYCCRCGSLLPEYDENRSPLICGDCGHGECMGCAHAKKREHSSSTSNKPFISGLRGGMLNPDEISAINSPYSSSSDGRTSSSVTPTQFTTTTTTAKKEWPDYDACCVCNGRIKHKPQGRYCGDCNHKACSKCHRYKEPYLD